MAETRTSTMRMVRRVSGTSLVLLGLAGSCKNTVVRSLSPRLPRLGAEEPIGKRSSDELLGAESGYFCPSGFLFSTLSRLCVNDTEAIGPFPEEMVNKCKEKGVEKKVCESARWPIETARELRGNSTCPPGTTLDKRVGTCAAGVDVFGPFRVDLVTLCKKNGGGDTVCETMRWHRSFVVQTTTSSTSPVKDFPDDTTKPVEEQPETLSEDASGLATFPEPAATARSKTLTLWATFYNLPEAEHRADGVALRSMAGAPLGPLVSRKDWCDAAMEGSVRIAGGPGAGKTYNFAGTTSANAVDCSAYFNHAASGKAKFRIANGSFGDGVLDYQLLPLRSIAVDPHTIPYGSVVYIPAARGTVFEIEGKSVKHDGYFFAADAGGLIKNNHIDVYAGPRSMAPFSFIKSSASKTFEAYLISDAGVIRELRAKHLD